MGLEEHTAREGWVKLRSSYAEQEKFLKAWPKREWQKHSLSLYTPGMGNKCLSLQHLKSEVPEVDI